MYNFELVILLEKILGKSKQKKSDEYSFKCPFCTHSKRRFRINFTLKKWHCFACNAGGSRIYILLRKINISQDIATQILKLLNEYVSYEEDQKETKYDISLPQKYKPLYIKSEDPIYKNAIHYLRKRGIGPKEILRYSIGYCTDGVYSNRIIIPSYDEDGKLNYFIARDIFPNSNMKYKNPPMSKDTVVFELFINWNEPIVLVEGSFDAIAVRKNVIPLLGKFPSKSLVKKLVTKKVKKVYVALDTDAKKDAAKLVKFLMDNGIEAYLLSMKEKDPAELGFENFWKRIEQTEKSTFTDIIRGKLYG